MRGLTHLTAAVAATGALALIPLAAASTTAASAASTSASSVINAGSSTPSADWAGYVDTMKHPGGYNQFKGVTATFTVRGVNCSKSVIGGPRWPAGTPGHKYYSAASFWVGLDGTSTDSQRLEQAGIGATCASKTASAQYYGWWQMTPNEGNQQVTLTSSKGAKGTVRAGDVVTVFVWDTDGVTPNSPKWGNPADAGYTYSVSIQDKTRGISWYKNGLRPDQNGLPHGSRAPDRTAEVITEAVSNGPYANAKYTIGLADMGTVSYTHAMLSAYDTGWIYAQQLASNHYWTAAKYSVDVPRDLIGTTALTPGNEESSFSTYWNYTK